MSALTKKKKYTPEEYLDLERRAEKMSEFHNGKVVRRASSDINHARMMSDFVCELGSVARSLEYRVFSVGLKVRTIDSDYFLYPDILVLGEKSIFHDKEKDVILNPILVAEIYSRETSHFDRNEKFIIYQSFESIKEIVFISQYQFAVQSFYRKNGDIWEYKDSLEPKSSIKFDSIKATVKLEKIYDRVQ
jgi:Uma2 family endonuclease